MAVAVKRASEHTIAITNRCPSFVIKVNIICQCDECVFGVYFLAIHLLRQIRQLRAVADLVGIILRAGASSKRLSRRTVPRIHRRCRQQHRDIPLLAVRLFRNLGRLRRLRFLRLLGVLRIFRIFRIFRSLGSLRRLRIFRLLGILGILHGLSVGQAALRGKGRGCHQREREHQAHQQAHDAPGHTACPFLHVICLLSLLNVSI